MSSNTTKVLLKPGMKKYKNTLGPIHSCFHKMKLKFFTQIHLYYLQQWCQTLNWFFFFFKHSVGSPSDGFQTFALTREREKVIIVMVFGLPFSNVLPYDHDLFLVCSDLPYILVLTKTYPFLPTKSTSPQHTALWLILSYLAPPHTKIYSARSLEISQ